MDITMSKKNFPVANISNQLAFNLSWNLTFREWNVVLYLISKLDSKNQSSFDEQVVSVKELESALKTDNKKWGGVYDEVTKLRKSLLSKPIDFYTDVVIDGKTLMGGVNFFEMIAPERGADGSVQLRFKFTGTVKPLLLELNKRFVSIPQHKMKLMKNGHAIRFLIAAKAKRDMMRSHEEVSSLKYSLDDFRVFLGIPGKYADFRNFRRAVINKIQKEINEICDFLEIVEIVIYPKKGKPKREVEFLIKDRNNGQSPQVAFLANQDWEPSPEDIKSLCRSKLYSYNILIDYGVAPGIAYRQILPNIKGGEFFGFEDWYTEELLKVFNAKTHKDKTDQEGRAGAFVNWFLGTSFTEDQFPEILERVHARKKALQHKNPEAWDNRQVAKEMTSEAFKEQFESKKRENARSFTPSDFSSIDRLLRKDDN